MSPAKHVKRTAEEQSAREQEHSDAQAEMQRLESGESVPSDPADWPSGKAKFLTFGSEGDHAYGDGPTGMLGAAGVELHADGTKSIRGERARAEAQDAAADAAAAPAQPSLLRRLFGRGG